LERGHERGNVVAKYRSVADHSDEGVVATWIAYNVDRTVIFLVFD
jgi:hypothetical protein